MGIRLEHACTLFDPQTISLIARLDVDIYKKIIKTIFECGMFPGLSSLGGGWGWGYKLKFSVLKSCLQV